MNFLYPGFLLLILVLSNGLSFSQSPDLFSQINSPFDEMNPVVSPDGRTLYITIANHPMNIGGRKDPGDIWISTFLNGVWSTPVHGGKNINNIAFNAVAGISKDGNELYLLSHYRKDGSAPTTQGLAMTKKNGNEWSTPINITIPYFINRATNLTGYWNQDNSVIVLAAEAYTTYGAEDIYVSKFNENGWSELLNLGKNINTPFQEVSPILSNDGKMLYFASNGRNGYGSFDIYVSERLDDTWTNWSDPINLGSDVNSEGRELFFRIVPQLGLTLFTSTRNSDGYGDIKHIFDSVSSIKPFLTENESIKVVDEPNDAVKPGLLIIKGRVSNGKSGEAVAAHLRFMSDSLFSTDAAADGNYSIRLNHRNQFAIEVEAPGFINLSEKLSVQSVNLNSIELNFTLQPIEVGAVVNLKNVLFELGTTNLLEESFNELDVVVDFLRTNPKVEIELEGHTDNRGDAKKNLELSQQRVERIKSYLVSKGISSKRIKGRGFGGTRPIATNDSEEARKLNRRVEFRIVKN